MTWLTSALLAVYHSLSAVSYQSTLKKTSDPRITGDFSRIVSPFIKPNRSLCFTFWYHMYGATVGNLSVYIRVSGQTDKLLWRKNGNKGKIWKKAQVDVFSSIDFQVRNRNNLHLMFGLICHQH